MRWNLSNANHEADSVNSRVFNQTSQTHLNWQKPIWTNWFPSFQTLSLPFLIVLLRNNALTSWRNATAWENHTSYAGSDLIANSLLLISCHLHFPPCFCLGSNRGKQYWFTSLMKGDRQSAPSQYPSIEQNTQKLMYFGSQKLSRLWAVYLRPWYQYMQHQYLL